MTPSPLNPLGAKGIGESATIGSTPAVHNAIVDALSHLGVRHIDMPCTAERVWRAMRSEPAVDDLVRSPDPCCGSPSRSTPTIVGSCYDGLPDEACGLLIGPLRRDGQPTGA